MRDCKLFLQLKRCFDYGRDQAAVDMPFDMTMEEPYAWVIASEPQHNMTVWPHKECVSSHWHRWHRHVAKTVALIIVCIFEKVLGVVISVVIVTSYDGLEVVPV